MLVKPPLGSLALGNLDGDVSEFKQALSLDPKQTKVQLELAAALEKNAD